VQDDTGSNPGMPTNFHGFVLISQKAFKIYSHVKMPLALKVVKKIMQFAICESYTFETMPRDGDFSYLRVLKYL
jgi:hypothetical protein